MILFMIFFFLVSIYMTIYLKWPQFKAFKNIKKCKNKKSKQTFYLTLATNLGVGNLVGVSAAIKLGGPGVIFWMALFAFFTSSLAFLENYYAVKSQTTIDNQQFAGTSYTIPDSVTSIGEYAFSNCDRLERIDVPENVKHIGERAFIAAGSVITKDILADDFAIARAKQITKTKYMQKKKKEKKNG